MMAILLHGTTRQRAERIAASGPDPNFVEPAGGGIKAREFSAYTEGGPFIYGPPEEYACRKDRQFPHEGGPVILRMEVPDELVEDAADEALPEDAGLVQFDGQSLARLRAAWPSIPKSIAAVTC